MKQTAVEWLEEELKANLKKVILEGDSKLMESLFKQAKEMEKEQIIDAYIRGNYKSNRDIYWKKEDANKYYNETFKNKKI